MLDLIYIDLTYIYKPELNSGYYSPTRGWHLIKSPGQLVYNFDENGTPFFNKITQP
jgi:hypothetical protein